MSQISRPVADVTVAGWRQNGIVVGTLYTQVDDVVADDGDYMTSAVTTTECEIALGAVGNPDIDTGHELLIRARQSDASAQSMMVGLFQGATLIKQWPTQELTTEWAEYTLPLPPAEAAAIGDYSDLRLRFQTGEASVANSIHISQVYLTVPDLGVPKREVVLSYEVAPVEVGQTKFGVQRKPGPERYLTTNDWYRLLANLGDERYAAWELQTIAGLAGGANLVNQVTRALLMTPAFALDSEGRMVLAGGGWSVALADAGALGGSYRHTSTPGATATWVTPPNTTRVGLRHFVAANGGMARVTIDGDPTRANLLPSAQELVDLGRLASLGSFAATDRVLDHYPAATNPPSSVTGKDRSIGLADGLDPGEHTIVLEATAEQSVLASGNRLYVSGLWSCQQDTTPLSVGASMEVLTYLFETGRSAWEFAHQVDAGGQEVFVGNVHGYETQTAIEVLKDGAGHALAEGADVWGDDLEVRRSSTFDHINPAVITLAAVTTRYRLGASAPVDSVARMRIEHTIDWESQSVATSVRSSYPCMLTVDGTKFRTGRLRGPDDGPFDLTVRDVTPGGDIDHGKAIAESAEAVWDGGPISGAHQGVTVRLTPVEPADTVNGWADSAPNFVFIQDRTPGASVYGENFSKLYVTRVAASDSVTITTGPVWTSKADYSVEVPTDQTISPAAIASGQAVSTPNVVQQIAPASIASAAAAGTPTVAPAASTVTPASIASGAAFGSPVVSLPPGQTAAPPSIASAAAVGTPGVTRGAAAIRPEAIGPTSAVGSPAIGVALVTVAPEAIASLAAVGAPALEPANTLAPAGIATLAAIGLPIVDGSNDPSSPVHLRTRHFALLDLTTTTRPVG